MTKQGSTKHRFVFPEQTFTHKGISLEYQETLEAIIDKLPGYVFWKDINSVYLGINENGIKIFGIQPESVVGKTDYECPWGQRDPATAHSFRQHDLLVMRTGQIHIDEHSLNIKNKDGLEIIVRTEKSPLRNKEGKIIGVLGIAVDVTEQRKLEKELELAKLELAIQKFGLTPRELECIGQLLLGKTALEIAEALTLSTRTVETHLDNIKNKVGCSKKSELIALLLQHGFSAAS